MRSRKVFISVLFCSVCNPSCLYTDGNNPVQRGKLGDAGRRGSTAGGERGSVPGKGLMKYRQLYQ